MTGPRIDLPLGGRVLSGDEWERAQAAPPRVLTASDPTKETTNLGRVLTGDEWEQAQRMSGPQLRSWKIPALPSAPRDMTATPIDRVREPKGKQIGGIGGEILKQLVDPVLEHPFQTLATAAVLPVPVVGQVAGGVMAGSLASNVAQYGFQKYLETHATPDARKEMEADPERISGEAAAVQAVMFGLAPLVHVAVKATASDYSAGMMESGAKGAAAEIRGLTPTFRAGFDDAHKTAAFASSLEDGAAAAQTNQRFGVRVQPPKGLEVIKPSRVGAGVAPVDGLVAPEAVTPGKVTPIATEAPAEPLAATADLSNTITDGIAELRRQDAERASRIRRRPQGERVPFIETESGALTLGAAAGRHGADAEMNPYHADAMPAQAAAWNEGRAAAIESYPEGFSMGGSLTDNRIPADYTPPRTPGFEPTAIPEGVTPETIALADAMKPSRFRGHSNEDLIAAAVDAQDRLEKAQSAQAGNGEGSQEMARYHAEAGDNTQFTHDVGGNPFYAKSVERELIRAKSALTQIEREAALRGLTGDDLAERVAAAKEQRAERQAMQEEDTLALHAGDDPFATPEPAAHGVAAVDGTGAVRTRGLSRGVVEKALANHLELTVAKLPEYRSVNMAEQSAQAVQLLTENPALARRIALGEAVAPHGLLPESVFVAVENAALKAGDVATVRELATSRLTDEATGMGQRLRALGERDPESPVAAMRTIEKVRTGGAENVARTIAKEVDAAHASVKAVTFSREALHAFADSLKC